MKPRRFLSVLFVSAMVAGACHSEPSYADRDAHEWIDGLRAGDLRGRVHAATALGQILEIAPDSPHVIAALIEALNDVDPVRMAAAAALSAEGLRAPGALSGLHSALHDSAHAEVRASAASALGSLGGSAGAGTIAVLIEALGDTDPRVRASAADALNRIGPRARTALNLIDKLVSDPVPFVRISALRASQGISRSAQRTIPALHEALGDSSADVRAQAIYALAAYGSDAGVVIPDIVASLSDSAAGVRRAAAYALGSMGTPRSALQHLTRLKIDPDAGVRREAVRALQVLEPR